MQLAILLGMEVGDGKGGGEGGVGGPDNLQLAHAKVNVSDTANTIKSGHERNSE